jgi:Ran GTPase-activating protein (RanGAP) involved in mRNA processing and transport
LPAAHAFFRLRPDADVSVDAFRDTCGHANANDVALRTAQLLPRLPHARSVTVACIGCAGDRKRNRDMGVCNEPGCTSCASGVAALVAAAPQVERFRLFVLDCPRIAPIFMRNLSAALPGLRELDLYSCCIDDAGAAAAAPQLPAFTQLSALTLSRNKFGVAGTAALAAALEQLATLRRLSIGHTSIGKTRVCGKLGPALRALVRLTALELQFERLEVAAAAALGPHLASLAALERLSVLRNKASGAGAAALLRPLKPLAALTHITFAGNAFAGAEGLHEVCEAAPALVWLQASHSGESQASHSGLSGAGARAFAAGLGRLSALQRLSLPSAPHKDAPPLAVADVAALSVPLATLTALTHVDVSRATPDEAAGGARNGGRGAAAPAGAAAAHAAVRRSGRGSRATARERLAVGATMRRRYPRRSARTTSRPTSRRCRTAWSRSTSATLAPATRASRKLVDAAAALPALTTLLLSKNGIGAHGARRVAPLLPRLRGLVHLELNDCDIGSERLPFVLHHVTVLSALTCLGLEGNKLVYKGAKKEFAPVVDAMPALRVLRVYRNGFHMH